MIVATKTVDSLLRGVISPDALQISRIDSVIESMQLDPNISGDKKEMYVISNDDIKNPKVRKEFELAVRNKHPQSLIMYLNKNGRIIKGIEPEMFEAYLVKPKREEVKAKFFDLVAEAEAKAKFTVDDDIGTPEEFNIEDTTITKITEEDSNKKVVKEEDEVISLKYVEEEVATAIDDEVTEPSLLQRIKDAENWASITEIAKEVTASRILQEITEANASFKQSENYVTSLNENITAIIANPEYDTTTRLSKVRAILHDRAHLKAKNNSVVEQSVEEMIKAIIDVARVEVEAKTTELDETILMAFRKKNTEGAPNVRLATIIEQRANTLIELHALDLEIKGIASQCNGTINDTVDRVVTDSTVSTDSPILDSQMTARFGTIVPENTVEVLESLFRIGQESSEEFGKMSEAVNSTVRKLYQLLALYQEENEVLHDTIRYLKANKVEDTVLAETILKKTSRLFINNGDFDSIGMAYIISKHNSRKNNNVLLLDLTKTNVINLFGVETHKYSEFMERDMLEDKLLIVSDYDDPGVSLTTPEDCQRLSTRILHYAKHYSMINIMCTPEQQAILDNFKDEVLSMTYLVDCYKPTIKTMAKVIEETKVSNTANRIILMNYISDSAKICKELNVMDRLEIQLSTCKVIPSIRYCSLHNQDPYDVESIIEDCRDVLKVC